jgi:hypothetical protein
VIDFELRVAHPCGVQGCGFSDPRFPLSRWPIPICPFFARGVFRREEKTSTLHKNREECGTRKSNPTTMSGPRSIPMIPFFRHNSQSHQ